MNSKKLLLVSAFLLLFSTPSYARQVMSCLGDGWGSGMYCVMTKGKTSTEIGTKNIYQIYRMGFRLIAVVNRNLDFAEKYYYFFEK